MFDASEAGTWQCKEQIPVVVVQLGYWPQNDRAENVREAEYQYCEQDPRAELVVIDDLSRNYHVDAPSFLIGGYRIAQAYQVAAQANITCPSSTPSTPPTSPHTSDPLSAPSSTSSKFWMDWNSLRCVKDCKRGPPHCGGKAKSWQTRYVSVSECCSKNLLNYVSVEQCQLMHLDNYY